MNDKILIKMVNIETNEMVSAYYTTNWSEPLKMYSFLKENELPYFLTANKAENEEKEYTIEDIRIAFGSRTNLNVITIYVEEL